MHQFVSWQWNRFGCRVSFFFVHSFFFVTATLSYSYHMRRTLLRFAPHLTSSKCVHRPWPRTCETRTAVPGLWWAIGIRSRYFLGRGSTACGEAQPRSYAQMPPTQGQKNRPCPNRHSARVSIGSLIESPIEIGCTPSSSQGRP
jgi:hypothetical protein